MRWLWRHNASPNARGTLLVGGHKAHSTRSSASSKRHQISAGDPAITQIGANASMEQDIVHACKPVRVSGKRKAGSLGADASLRTAEDGGAPRCAKQRRRDDVRGRLAPECLFKCMDGTSNKSVRPASAAAERPAALSTSLQPLTMREHGLSGAPIGALATAATLFLELHNMKEAGEILDVRHTASTSGEVAATGACASKGSKDSCAREPLRLERLQQRQWSNGLLAGRNDGTIPANMNDNATDKTSCLLAIQALDSRQRPDLGLGHAPPSNSTPFPFSSPVTSPSFTLHA